MFDNLERNNIRAGITHLLPTKGLLNKEMGAPWWLEGVENGKHNHSIGVRFIGPWRAELGFRKKCPNCKHRI